MSKIRLIHVADLHIGFTGPSNLILTENEDPAQPGRYVREVDIENAVSRITDAIIAAQPPVDIVLIAGDLFHKPAPSPRAITCATRMVHRLTRKGIAVVIIDGNHETSNVLHTGSPTTFLRALGAQVVNNIDARIIRDSDWQQEMIEPARRERLRQLAVHALPYRALENPANLVHITPLEGYINVLLTHGRLASIREELNSLHKKSHIIPNVLVAGHQQWDYIALGDWHIHRFQPSESLPAYYAGSLEALNFGEAVNYPPGSREPYEVHGAIDVYLTFKKPPEIKTLPNQQARPLLHFKEIDALQMDVDAVMKEIRARFQESVPPHALVTLDILNLHPDVWAKLDHKEIAHLKRRVRLCTIIPTLQRISSSSSAEMMSESTLDRQWERFLETHETDIARRAWCNEVGLKRIEEAQQFLFAKSAQEGE